MIIVTGFPRSGTSLVMNTLFLLGYPVFGIPFPPGRDPAWQPSGTPFWEHPDTMAAELQYLMDSDVAVKVHLRKAIEKRSPRIAEDKIIACVRNQQDLAQAMTDLGIGSGSVERNLVQIQKWYGKATAWAGETPRLNVDLDQLRGNPTAGVNAIKNFLEITPDAGQISRAIAGVV